MASKFGKNGEAVAAFLDEVSATGLDGWRRAFLDLDSPSPELSAAVRAVSVAPLSALRSGVGSGRKSAEIDQRHA